MPAPDFLYLPAAQTQPESSAVASVAVAPAALFAVVDHFLRRGSETSDVLGLVVGVSTDSDIGTDVSVRACLPLKVDVGTGADSAEIAVDMDHFDSVVGLHRKAFPDEEVVGWYSTGGEVAESAAAVHGLVVGVCGGAQPVHLLVDATLPTESLAARAFVCSPLGLNSTSTTTTTTTNEDLDGYVFNEVPVAVAYDDTDRVGLNLMLEYAGVATQRQQQEKQQLLVESAAKAAAATVQASMGTQQSGNDKQEEAKRATEQFAQNASALLSDMSNLEHVISQIRDMLTYVTKYVEDVNSGTIKGDAKLGEILMETVSVAPKMDAEEFAKLFNDHLQDLLMVVYLANLTKLKAINS